MQRRVMKGQETCRTSSSCAACKFLKRKCIPNCQFAPYFRSDESIKFAKVHKVFGASNVCKILNEVPEEHREDAVNSLVYEAEVRLRDPIYGCIGAIASLQRKMAELQHDLVVAKACLAAHCAAAKQAAYFMYDHDQHLNMSFLSEVNECYGFFESHNQDSLGSYQGGSMNEFNQMLFP